MGARHHKFGAGLTSASSSAITCGGSLARSSHQEKGGVEAAIRAVTWNAAWQCHSENELGSLEPEKFADFVIIETDPRKTEPTAGRLPTGNDQSRQPGLPSIQFPVGTRPETPE
ncbi:MAG: amidohydrolase family protein [Hyphomicrobiales bacterium]|nr:amidohydrolase family protein [Hyphomicrobiales bacterium]